MPLRLRILSLTALLAALPLAARAGAGYIITASGAPSKWDNSAAISIHPESGVCGTFTNAQMLDKIEENLDHWTNLTETSFSFSIVSGSLDGVDGCNYDDYLVGVNGSNDSVSVNDGFNPILFDNDGEIVSAVAGSANKFRVLGFANPAGFSSDYSRIVDGQAVFNCRCLSGNEFGACTVGSQTITFSEEELDFTMVHEMGHFMNLDHTQVNCTGSGSDNLCSDSDTGNDDDIPTMYPVSENASAQITPIQDDISALGGIYPSSTFTSSHCLVRGSLLYSGGQEMRCADVQAIPSDTNLSVAFVSGSYAPAVDNNGDGDTADSGECSSDCGDFQLYLDPNVAYTIGVRAVNSSFTGGSGISPCANAQLTNIESETIAQVTAAQCTAGATVNLGDITTSSTYSSSQTGGVSSSLVKSAVSYVPNEYEDALADSDYYASALDAEDDLPPRLIGGAPLNQDSDSCPESGGSSSSGGTNGVTSTSSSGGGSGCALLPSATKPDGSVFLLAALGLLSSILILGARKTSA